MGDTKSEILFLLKHSGVYGFAQIASKFVALLLLPLYTRYLTPLDYGVMEILSISNGLVGIVIEMSVLTAMSRLYFNYEGKDDQNSVVSSIYLLIFISTSIGFILIYIYSDNLSKLLFGSYIYSEHIVFSIFALLTGVINSVGIVYQQVLQKSHIVVSLSFAALFITVLLNILFIAVMGYGLLGFFYAGVINNLIIGIPLIIYTIRVIKLRYKISIIRDILKFSLPLLPARISHAMIGYSDRYFLNYFLTPADVGIYGISQKFGTMIHYLVTVPFNQTYLPRRFEIAHKPDSPYIFSRIFDYYMLAVISSTLLLASSSDFLLFVFATEEYYRAVEYIPFTSLVIIILGMKYHFQFGYLYTKKTIYESYILVISLMIHLSTNYYLIPRIGIWGAVYAFFIATTFVTIAMYFAAQREFKIKYNFICLAKLTSVASIIYYMTTLVVFTDLLMSFSVRVVSIVILYPVCLYILKIISNEDISNLYSIAKKACEILSDKYLKIKKNIES